MLFYEKLLTIVNIKLKIIYSIKAFNNIKLLNYLNNN